MMKLLLCVGVVMVFAATSSPVKAGEAQNAVTACMKSGGVTEEDLKTIKGPKGPNQKVKCMVACTMKGLKYMKADNSFDKAVMKAKFPKEAAPSVDTCSSQAETQKDQCQRGFIFGACMMMSQPKLMSSLIDAE